MWLEDGLKTMELAFCIFSSNVGPTGFNEQNQLSSYLSYHDEQASIICPLLV
jgi:hypothetical protein